MQDADNIEQEVSNFDVQRMIRNIVEEMLNHHRQQRDADSQKVYATFDKTLSAVQSAYNTAFASTHQYAMQYINSWQETMKSVNEITQTLNSISLIPRTQPSSTASTTTPFNTTASTTITTFPTTTTSTRRSVIPSVSSIMTLPLRSVFTFALYFLSFIRALVLKVMISSSIKNIIM